VEGLGFDFRVSGLGVTQRNTAWVRGEGADMMRGGSEEGGGWGKWEGGEGGGGGG